MNGNPGDLQTDHVIKTQADPTAATPQAVRYCTYCGARNAAGAKFCGRCGQPMERPSANTVRRNEVKPKKKKPWRILIAAVVMIVIAAVLIFVLPDRKPDEDPGKPAAEERGETKRGNSNFKNVKKDDEITFGAYEQNNDTSDGKEEIEWIVLEVTDGKALLISKYALDCLPYHDTYEEITWEDCTLREWLNDAFLDEAFSKKERDKIQCANVPVDTNLPLGTDPGSATDDYVFLLSVNEANRYFSDNVIRRCTPTAYARANGAPADGRYKVLDGAVTCWWWLRSPGSNRHNASYVENYGSTDYSGVYVYDDDVCVRPALWIELDS